MGPVLDSDMPPKSVQCTETYAKTVLQLFSLNFVVVLERCILRFSETNTSKFCVIQALRFYLISYLISYLFSYLMRCPDQEALYAFAKFQFIYFS